MSRRGVVPALAAVAAVLHLLPYRAYGLFRDELYYLACVEHLAWGYVDHPPLSIFVLAANGAVFGTSILALRWLPALAAAGTVLIAAWMARRLGGGPRASALAALAALSAPILLVLFDFYSMNAFEVLAWTCASALAVNVLSGGDERGWLGIGAVLGLGLLNKHTTAVFGAALGLGLLATPAREHLRRRWIWMGAALGAVLVLPNVAWQIAQSWPSLEFYRNAMLNKNVDTPPHLSILIQAFVSNPGALPMTVAGFWLLLRSPRGRAWRALGVACVVLVLLHVASGSSRPDRIAGIYPLVFAAGAVALERAASRPGRRWLLPAAAVLTGICGLAFLPIGTGVFPPQVTSGYTGALGRLIRIERGKSARLPQWLADRSEWDRIASQVADVVDGLSGDERARTIVYAENYGEAGALEYFGPARGMPPVVSNHNSYFHWSRPRLDAGDVLVALGPDRADLAQLFDRVEEAGRTRCTWCLDYENGVPIYVARGPKVKFSAVWERFKNYD